VASLPGERIGVSCGTNRALALAILGVQRARRVPVVVSRRSGLAASELALDGLPVLVDEPCGLPLEVPLQARAAARRRWGRGTSAIVLHTSETTGLPKPVARARFGVGVLRQLGGLLAALPLARVREAACLTILDHGHGFGTFAACVGLGITFVDVQGLSAAEAVELMRRTGADLLTGVPAQFPPLLDEPADGCSVRVVVSGSDELDDHLVGSIGDHFGAALYNCYGSSELGTVCVASPTDLAAAPSTEGRPLAGVRVRVVDAEGRAVPTGTEGVVEISSPLGDEGVHRLDRGYLDAEGRLFVTGRADGVRVSGGENVVWERLSAYLGALPGVVSVELRPERDERFGVRPAAVLTLAPGFGLDPEAVRLHARRDLGPALTPVRVEVDPS